MLILRSLAENIKETLLLAALEVKRNYASGEGSHVGGARTSAALLPTNLPCRCKFNSARLEEPNAELGKSYRSEKSAIVKIHSELARLEA